ncbi:copper amine oxidase N-terminal domain-containing protein [Saccharibacillus sp. JS10]|uniref:copper amine oxidase N-terminal domain-containing protein n=1 Tax=Saccharibacillus sp. JS10 TaxID=2950552 RepID=UPI00210DB890|nr:copper amine oxidase N-terminal domain-containing protein [Saccharibacillus sp. JS10]MCQ4085854.1 copper amine oxidase N-terminal domain-containing protein [Saccharibacillus sp. JS10]
MKGNPIIKSALAVTILAGTVISVPQIWDSSAYAQSSADASIRQGLDNMNYILEDGSLRAEGHTIGSSQEPSPFIGIARNSQTDERYAWTKNGHVYEWRNLGLTGAPKLLTGLPAIAQVSHDVMLTQNGDVVDYTDIGLPGAIQISAHSSGFALLTANGEVWRYRSDYSTNKVKKLATLPGTKDIQATSSYVAVLQADGTVTRLDAETDSKPETITTNAVSIAWVKEEASNDLYIAKSDGSLWKYEYGNPKAGEMISAVRGAAFVSPAEEGLFVRLKDGTSGLYSHNKWTEIAPASLKSAVLTLSKTSAGQGENVKVTVEEKFTDGSKSKRSPVAGELRVSNTKVATVQADGSLKTNGLGSTSVTFNSGGVSATSTLIVKQEGALTGAGFVSGSAYLPVRPVFAALGASVTTSGNLWNIQYGDTKIQLQKGSTKASVNGKTVSLKGKVQTLDGQTVFPASFLSNAIPGSSVKWDSKLQQAVVSLGSAKLEVESKATALLKKKQQLGSLAKYLGKSYWVNHYEGVGIRFSKLTIADIIVTEEDYGRGYTIVFKNAAGSTFKSGDWYANAVGEVLNDADNFFSFDPRVRFGGSDAIWNYIRGNYVAPGMNKQHVLLSWGEPSYKGVEKNPRGPVEVWIYYRQTMDWQAVAFLNGYVDSTYDSPQ